MPKEHKKYIITKEQCEHQIKELGDNVVCPYCGRKLQPIETVDNAGRPTYWPGCMHGSDYGHFTYGVSKKTYETAKKIVLEDWDRQSSIYDISSINTDEKFKLWFEGQVSSWCKIIDTVKRFEKDDVVPRYTYEELKFRILGVY